MSISVISTASAIYTKLILNNFYNFDKSRALTAFSMGRVQQLVYFEFVFNKNVIIVIWNRNFIVYKFIIQNCIITFTPTVY